MLVRAVRRVEDGVMNQTTLPAPESAPQADSSDDRREWLPLHQHNPVTEQLLLVGKRRETAEAQLQQRLLERRPAKD